MNNKLLFFPFLFFLLNCNPPKPTTKMKDQFTFEGRVMIEEDSAKIFWPGSSISFETTSSYVDFVLKDDVGESKYSIIIDGIEQEKVIVPTSEKTKYRVYEGNNKKHHITLHRRNDFTKGTTTFYGVESDGNIVKSEPKKKWIEFYGNSITVGYANIDTTGEDNPLYTNNYVAYSALTARNFDAKVSCIARSGIGVMVSWFDLIMPELYDRHNPNEPDSKWGFKEEPNLVVINLFQNDSWIFNNPDNEFYIKRIGRVRPTDAEIISHYKSLVTSIRSKYPNAPIICMLGCMDIVSKNSVWVNYVEQAVSELSDSKIYTYNTPFIAKTTHPTAEMHLEMSRLLTEFIKEKNLL